jgi:hypothetical protein
MIVQGKQHIESWYSKKLPTSTRVALLEFRYTNKEIALHYLNYLIQHTNASLDKLLKVLLMN